MEAVAGLSEADTSLSLGELASRLGEPDPWRVADAIMAVRVASGERTYIEIRADEEPAVARALEADRGTIVSGWLSPPL
jgi:hypothetical protein